MFNLCHTKNIASVATWLVGQSSETSCNQSHYRDEPGDAFRNAKPLVKAGWGAKGSQGIVSEWIVN